MVLNLGVVPMQVCEATAVSTTVDAGVMLRCWLACFHAKQNDCCLYKCCCFLQLWQSCTLMYGDAMNASMWNCRHAGRLYGQMCCHIRTLAVGMGLPQMAER
jgi:hypothetical protein